MKKKPPSPPLHPLSFRRIFWFSWKLMIIFSIILCVVSLYSLYYGSQSQSQSQSHSESHRAHIRNRNDNFVGISKIAFLFLARRNLPLDFLWGSFFENVDVSYFSIYVHSEPGFVFDESTTRSSLFYNRQLTNSIKVGWGESSMIEAERLLLGAALDDPANRRFVLLSDSCVPLYNFSYIYSYLMSSSRSFVDSFLDKKEGRYNPKMSPVIPMKKWRKGSQWFALIRNHAEVIVDDEVVLPAFKKYCKRRPPVEAGNGKLNSKLQKLHNCIPDEHYVPTLLAFNEVGGEVRCLIIDWEGVRHPLCQHPLGLVSLKHVKSFKKSVNLRKGYNDIGELEREIERRTITYTSWNQSATKMETKGWHPFTYTYATAGPEHIKRIKDINHVYYETEYRTEWCSNNFKMVPCFLFARKFSTAAAMRLLSEGVVGGGPFEASSLLQTAP